MRTARALVILGFSLSLVACGGSGPSSPPESATPTASSSRETPLSPTAQAQAHSNLLYVIDSAGGSADGNQVLVVDPTAKSVIRSIPSDYTPDAALSPDGHFLYVASSHPYISGPSLATIDTSTWATVGKPIDITGRVSYVVYPDSWDRLALSPDGKLIYFIKYGDGTPSTCNGCDSYIAAVDVTSGQLAKNIHLAGCGAVGLSFDPNRPLLDTFCVSGQTVVLDLQSSNATPLPVFGAAWESVVGAGGWYIITRDLKVFPLGTDAFDARYYAGPIQSVSLPVPEGNLATGGAALSPDGTLYVGFGSGEHGHEGQADEIWAFDVRTWKIVSKFRPQFTAFHFALSRDGQTLYTVNATQRTLSIIDVATGREDVMHEVGHTPAKILVAP